MTQYPNTHKNLNTMYLDNGHRYDTQTYDLDR
jgi:hypothetical protein